MIERIDRYDNYDEAWLSEIPTPNNFKQDLVIWVDDVPNNNLKYVSEVVSKGFGVIQLTSTKMTERWISEYGWLLN